jgi:ATP-dependent helicase/nuclease subunit B
MASLARALGQTAEMMAAQSMRLQSDGQHDQTLVADATDGAMHLWDKQGGKAAADLLKNLVEHGHDQAVNVNDFAQTLVQIMQDITVHAAQQSHPRLAVLGAVESRMQTADHLIIAGFNEGNWPPQPHSDPWMNSDMRKAVGLPPHNWRTSLSAHDIYMAICAPKVTITRAQRQNDVATIPSRWLQRMEVVLSALGITNALDRGDAKFDWLETLNPKTLPHRIKRPAPTPPVSARPRKFSATEIDMWINDPYALYAKKILKLRQLDDIDRPPDAALRGTLFHNVLADFTRAFPSGPLPDDAYETLLAIGKTHFADQWATPDIRYFWWPRFEMVAGWIIETENQRRDDLAFIYAEKKGSTILSGPAGAVELSARADRLEKTKDGTWHIIDYKTGIVPSKRKVADGRATQLLIEALIAWDGGYDDRPGCEIAKMQYWKLSGRKGNIGNIDDVLPDEGTPENTRMMMQGLITLFDNPEVSYPAEPNIKYKLTYNPYKHLARINEWRQEGHDE